MSRPRLRPGSAVEASSAPLSDWKVTRLKSEPDESLVGLCKDSCPGKSACCMGYRTCLTSGRRLSETQTREAFRRFVLTAIEPSGAHRLADELTRVFEVFVARRA